VNLSWLPSAACRGEDTSLFFSAEGERQPERGIREAKARAVCGGCQVREDCLAWSIGALSGPGLREKSGIWGGMDEGERAQERRRRQRRARGGWTARDTTPVDATVQELRDGHAEYQRLGAAHQRIPEDVARMERAYQRSRKQQQRKAQQGEAAA
jgi:WhiB family redox-sensing transcriptional regulator